jgi:hypothetical protein
MLRDEARPISVKLDQKLTTRHGKKKREQFLSVLRPTLTNTTMKNLFYPRLSLTRFKQLITIDSFDVIDSFIPSFLQFEYGMGVCVHVYSKQNKGYKNTIPYTIIVIIPNTSNHQHQQHRLDRDVPEFERSRIVVGRRRWYVISRGGASADDEEK